MSLLEHEFKALGKQKLWNMPVTKVHYSRLFHTCFPFDSFSAKSILVNQFNDFYRYSNNSMLIVLWLIKFCNVSLR